MNKLTLAHVTIGHRRKSPVFQDLNIEFRTGITAILGSNGAGKSTLLSALANPRRIQAGQVHLNDVSVRKTPEMLRNYFKTSGYIPQKWEYIPGFTVRESIEYAAWLKEVPKQDTKTAVTEAITQVNLQDRSKTKLSQLSGGMRQRVGLAEALVHNPKVLILDEPTVGLDPQQRRVFRELLTASSKERIVLLSTHLIDDVATVADRVIVVDAGRIAFDGTSQQLAKLAPQGESATARRLELGYEAVLREQQ